MASFEIPGAELCRVTDLHRATVVGCDHETDCVVCRDCYRACVVNHEVVVRALLEWFTVEVAVDVVLQLRTASLIDRVRLGWRYCGDDVADRVQSCDWCCVNCGRPDGEQDCWKRDQPTS